MKKEYRTPSIKVIRIAPALPVSQSQTRMNVFDKDNSQSDNAIDNDGYYVGDIY